jgi:hypothetical protein
MEKKKPAQKQMPEPKRPSRNPAIPPETLDSMINRLSQFMGEVEPYAVHLRPLDRQRLRGVGLKKQGFIEGAYSLAVINPQFLPSYLTIEKLRKDIEYSANIRILFDLCKQLYEYVHNLDIQSSDVKYTDMLAFYASVRKAAKRRIDGAQTIHRELEPFFKHPGAAGEALTEKKLKRDVNALLHGKRNGKIVIKNVKPKLTGGKRKVIDEQYDGSEQYKETEDGDKNL